MLAPKVKKEAAKKKDSSDSPSTRIKWKTNPRWTDRLVAELTEDVDLRHRLFSDSVSQAKDKGREPVTTNGKPKKELNEQLAEKIWNVEGESERNAFLANRAKYGTGVGSRIDSYVPRNNLRIFYANLSEITDYKRITQSINRSFNTRARASPMTSSRTTIINLVC